MRDDSDMSMGAPLAQSLAVYGGEDFTVVAGANLGDAMADAEEIEMDDVYALLSHRPKELLTLLPGSGAAPFQIAETSDVGQPGADVHLDCVVTLMTPDGRTLECLLLAEVIENALAAIHVLPLADLAPKVNYAIVGIDREAARERLASLASVSFTKGTAITLATGRQCPVEALEVGDRVLTRNNGSQPIRWIGRRTVRATGAFAPIAIEAGALNNTDRLVVSPHHRLFVYQRRDTLSVGRAEVLIKASDLVDGIQVQRTQGGFVEYFQLVFDHHEIIYAEGIAAESLLVDTRSEDTVPEEVRAAIARHEDPSHLMAEGASVAQLKRASIG